MDLLGRGAEREAVEHLLAAARGGRSGTLVVRGEAGIGKTTMLEHTRDQALQSGFRVESSVGVEAETQFAFAGLHQLCAPLLEGAEALPEPQQSALGVAFGRREGAVPDRFLVGLATLNLLAEAAEDRPLLCLVDDAQWLDEASAQVLAFVARRLAAERVALVFARREPGEDGVLAGLPQLRLDGLGESDARSLLAAAVHATLDDGVRDRIVAEARGNPLALLELPGATAPAQRAGGFEKPDLLDVPRRVEDSFRSRSGSLPTATQRLLLIAAAEPTGDVALLWRAATELGIAPDVAAAAEAAGLVEIGARVRFRHPLVRSAVYRAASPPERRSVHAALAAATDRARDPDRGAWHHARSVLGTDEAAAAALERSAGRARARGGVAASAAFLQQASDLSPEPADRARRALEAAGAKHEAGASEAARDLLSVAAAGPLDELHRARLQLLHARIAFHLTHDSQTPWMLADAAELLAPLDPALSRQTYLEAVDAALFTGALGHGRVVLSAREGGRTPPAAPVPPRPVDLLLDGLVTTFTHGYEAGVPGLRRAVEAFCRDDEHDVHDTGASRRWLGLASRIALTLFDGDLLRELADRNVRLARDAGALATLPGALQLQSAMLVFTGNLEHAAQVAAEEAEITQATGAVPLLHARLLLAAWRGEQTEAAELYEAVVQEATARRQSAEIAMAQYAMAVLHNGLSDYGAALHAAEQARRSDELTHTSLALPEVIEAASRAGRPDLAANALDQLDARARASGSRWALGLAARSRALTSSGSAAEEQYADAIQQLDTGKITSYLARTHLVYGEWLRREGRRHDARDQLRTAHELLSRIGAGAFADRAARELRATGEHPRSRTVQPTDTLTAHEQHIARLVATGATSREVGAELFLSPRTIEAHLRNIFRKLGITSRRQLKAFMAP